jgi:hypothetical protein
MDPWGWSALGPCMAERATLPVGPLFCVIVGLPAVMPGRAAPRGWSCTGLRSKPVCAGAWRPPAAPCPRRGVVARGDPAAADQRQLGHAYLSTTATYLQGISSEEIISTVHARRAPMMHASAGLAL